MEQHEHLSEVQRGERHSEDIHPDVVHEPELRLLEIQDEEHVREILTKYAELNVPREHLMMFQNQLLHRTDSVFFDAGMGLVYLTEILPRFQAHIQFVFWDRKLPKERRALIRHVASWAFDQLAIERIYGAFPAKNQPAINALRKCGFTYEGTFRSGWLDQDGFQDLIQYSMLRKEI